MKRTITILSLVLISSLVACDGDKNGHVTAANEQDTIYINDKSVDKDKPIGTYTADTFYTKVQIDEKERMVGLISFTPVIFSPIPPSTARGYIRLGFNRINQGQLPLNGNDPLAWKIAPSDLGGLSIGTDSAIAVLAEENGDMTLIIGQGINGRSSFSCNAMYETFKPIKRVNGLSTQQLKDQFEQELFSGPQCPPPPTDQ